MSGDATGAEDVGFPNTEWSLVLRAGQAGDAEESAALERLCRMYWPAVYAFLRRRGYASAEAQDLTQDFILCLLRRHSLTTADPAKGRFRSFLLGALKHFLADQLKHASALRRGGGRPDFSLDDDADDAESRYGGLASSDLPPDQAYDRQRAWRILERSLVLLREECARFGQEDRFEALRGYLTTHPSKGEYGVLADRLGMKPGTLAVFIHRLRRRYREFVRREATRTVTNVADLEDELRRLFGSG